MKVLLHHLRPFTLGGDPLQPAVETTRAALPALGIEPDFLRWYDGQQTGDILHFFGRMPTFLIPFAHQKKMKVVITDTIPARGWPPPPLKRALILLFERIMPWPVRSSFDWDSYRSADACIVSSPEESHRLWQEFRVPREKIHVVVAGEEAKLKDIYEGLLKTSR